MKKILIVDGNSILNRAFYGIRPLTAKDGLFTHAVYGFVNILFHNIEEVHPDYAVCAFDLHGPTFRHNAYDGYKANRHGMPEELAVQLPYAKECARKMGFYVATLQGYEADDIIGTASAFTDQDDGLHAYILTGDRDSLQLIGERVSVLLATNKETVLFDREKFISEYGVPPESFVDVKALMGDSSDNIPGVPGIGEKTALKLIADYGSLDDVYSGIEDKVLPKAQKQKLIDGKDSAYMSQFLARINRFSPIGFELSDTEDNGFDKAGLRELFVRLDFMGLIKRFGLDMADEDIPEEPKEIKKADISFALSLPKDAVCALVLDENVLRICTGEVRADIEYADVSELSGFLSDPERHFCVYDVKELYKRLLSHGTELSLNCFDIMLAAYVLDADRKNGEIKPICEYYLERPYRDGTDDCFVIYELFGVLSEKLKEDGTEKLYYETELPLARVLADMELCGFKVDRHGLELFGRLLSERCDALSDAIYECAGRKFNINSPKQLGEVLFGELGLPGGKSGSTKAEVLEKLLPYHPVISLILEYRQFAKLNSTYAQGLLAVADKDGMVHTTFKQAATATGRLASAEPNLQNIPIKTEIGRELRKFFLPSDSDHVLIDADYSQVELRILADISGDEKMTGAFKSGADIHTSTASEVFGIPFDEVTPELRKRAKAVNFGIVYGIGSYSLSQDIGVSKREADEYIKGYFERYPKIKEYIDSTVAFANEKGYVSTVFGRKRYIPELKGKPMQRAFGERVAMNSPIQGTSADLIKMAMVNIAKKLREEKLDAEIILQVHDELILNAKKEDAPAAADILKREMENAAQLSVPLTVEISSADNWYDCK